AQTAGAAEQMSSTTAGTCGVTAAMKKPKGSPNRSVMSSVLPLPNVRTIGVTVVFEVPEVTPGAPVNPLNAPLYSAVPPDLAVCTMKLLLVTLGVPPLPSTTPPLLVVNVTVLAEIVSTPGSIMPNAEASAPVPKVAVVPPVNARLPPTVSVL